jgi:ABC-2 type transport system permease protein
MSAITVPAIRRRPSLRSVLAWELRKLRAQARTRWTLLGALIGPVPIVAVIHTQARPPKDTLFGRFATDNGFAMALLVLGFAGQWILPLLTVIVAGDIFASEDAHGTWKTILTRSASRGQVFGAKAVAALGFSVLGLAVLGTSTVVASLVIGGRPPLTGLSGQGIEPGTATWLVVAAWASTLAPTVVFTCLALMLSVLARNPAVGIAAPVVIAMSMQLLGSAGGVEPLRPFLPTTAYETWHGLFVDPHFTTPLVQGLFACGIWSILCLAIAFFSLRRRDITGG